MRHHAFSRYTVINISKRGFSVFINARIRLPFANPVTYIEATIIKLTASHHAALNVISMIMTRVHNRLWTLVILCLT